METASGPIYEFTCSVDREIVDAFDSWLAQHTEEALQNPAISAAEIYQQEDDEQGRARRVAHYYFFSDTDLEQYLADQEDAGGDAASERFAGQIQTTRRILRHADIVDGELKPLELCLNCGTPLSGQYCGNCGQRATSRLISVWELLRDAFGDLLEVDSRLWRTLTPLMVRPGRLTLDYLEGARARYMPPFRMYLVLSIVFFLVAFFDPREELGILFEPVAPTAVQDPQDAAEIAAIREDILRDLADEGIIVATPADGAATVEDATDDPDTSDLIVSFSSDGDSDENCNVGDLDMADWPPWLSSRLTQERLLAACDAVIADDGRALGRKLLDNVPAALFVLLPLMALVLKVLYPLSKRYYVEHLLFVVHYHAFVFLILALQVLFARLGSLLRIPETVIDVTTLAVSLYVPVYLYKALRRVYGQGRPFTILKFLMLVFAYFTGLLILLILVALFAAFSI
jgi:hypothetical protein